MSHDVFLSYSRKDQRTAEAVRAALERRGLRVWIDNKSISGGSDWAGAIVGALNSSKVMVLIFSRNANASANVRREVERAVSKNITLIPFRVENVEPSDAFELFLSLPQWIDAYVGAPENHLDRLCDAVRAAVGAGAKKRSPAPPTPVPAPENEETAAGLFGGGKAYLAAGAGALFALCAGLYFLHLPPFSSPPEPNPKPVIGDGSRHEESGLLDARETSSRPYICHQTTEDCSTFAVSAPLEGPMTVESGIVKINGVEIDIEGAPNVSTLALLRLADSLAKTKTNVRCVKNPSGAYKCVTVGSNDDVAVLLTRMSAKKR